MWIKEIFSFFGFCLKVDIIVKLLSALSEQMWIEIFFAGNWKLTAITTTFLIKNQIHFISLNKIRAHTKAQHTDKKKNSSYNVSLSRFSVMIKVTNHHTANFHYEGKSHSLFHKQRGKKIIPSWMKKESILRWSWARFPHLFLFSGDESRFSMEKFHYLL